MPVPTPTFGPQLNGNALPVDKWGRASHYDFDNPQKWVSVYSVPLLDEHELIGADGQPEGYVDKSFLEEVARNNNRRVRETGDPATLILGHTSDDPRAPEKPAKGFVVNYKVKPFKRDPETGQIIYAIHADYKVRHKNAHLIEEYPRRSVELWVHKKELDPIAMLGGTTPERDLSVIIRKSRWKVALLGGTVPERDLGPAVRYSRHGDDTILRYVMNEPLRFDKDKMHKVMSEFKHGDLHSGSKHGPKVTSRDQAVAIGMSEAGLSRKHEHDDEKMRYAEGEDNEMDDEEFGHEEPDGDEGMGGGGFGGEDEGGEEDPVVAKVLQSKPFRDLADKVDQMFDAIMGGGEGGMGGPPAGAAPGGMGAEPMDGMGMEPEGAGAPGMGAPPPPEEEAAHFHGENPVRFGEDEQDLEDPMNYSASGFGGPTSVHIAGTGNGKKGYSRNGGSKVNAAARRPANGRQQANPELIRMKRQLDAVKASNETLVRKLARSEAQEIVNQLKGEGIIFGDNPEDAAKMEAQEAEFLAVLDERDRQWQVAKIRKCYKRAERNPGQPGMVGVAQYARLPEGATGGDADDFEPQTPQEAMEYANAKMRMPADKAVKYMRDKTRRRA